MEKCTIKAPGKINLHLGVGEKRDHGYHELESLFASLDFGDFLRFECTSREGDCNIMMNWEMNNEFHEFPLEENLVYRAVSLFREETGFDSGLNISLIKRIPLGAGLGGGSSDAASTLAALDFLARTALPMEKLEEMALKLGSDVPFFLHGGAAYVSGRGEIIEPLPSPRELWVVLVKPSFSSDTASAFRLLDRARDSGIVSKDKFSMKALSREAIVRALEDDPANWPFYNDFLPVFLEQDGGNALAYRHILGSLESLGASFTGLSGSGSCCFGVFNSENTALFAEKSLEAEGNFTRSTFFLAEKPNPVVEY